MANSLDSGNNSEGAYIDIRQDSIYAQFSQKISSFLDRTMAKTPDELKATKPFSDIEYLFDYLMREYGKFDEAQVKKLFLELFDNLKRSNPSIWNDESILRMMRQK